MNHPLHLAVADAIERHLPPGVELIRDPACGGDQHLPLFIGRRKARDTRMCCVDLLVVSSGLVRVIVEIEESGFLPTKICGKFLQAALADHFIHDRRSEAALPYGPHVLFAQVLDGSRILKPGTKKDAQAELIAEQVRGLLPLRGISDYQLYFARGEHDHEALASVGAVVSAALSR
jgi:hypothetical protein